MSLSKINSRINLEYLTKEKENLYFDRKRAKISLQDLANEIASFAKSNGGIIAGRTTDDGRIEGFNPYGKDKLNEFQKVVTNYLKNTPNYRIELIDIKNKELWHREASSLVKKDDVVVEYLKLQGFDYNTIVPEGKRVYLRTNSNCSTGGEAVDMTDIIPTKFKKVAEKAAKAFEAKICGVDIIIEDLKSDKYAIVEINDNPGYAINQWPYEGKGERIGLSILKLLDLVQ